MRLAVIIILTLVLIVVLVQGYFIFKERGKLKIESANTENKLKSLTAENESLRSEIEYFSHPENLEKELREKFNYHGINEKMKIIVP